MKHLAMQEARYYIKEGDGVRCTVCPHECRIPEGGHGICRSRVCHEGRLYSEVYGKPCALAIDPIEKKPLLHFHPGSKIFSLACTGCNFRCLNCQNSSISQAMPSESISRDATPEDIVTLCRIHDCSAIAYTYTEPLTYIEYIEDIASQAKAKGISNVLVSAGYVNSGPLEDLCQWLDAANIDLKSFSDSTYRRLNGGSLGPVLDTLKTLLAHDVWLEITNLLIPGWNDDMDMIRDMCKWLKDNGFENCPLHFSRFYPAYRLTDVGATPLKTLLSARDVAHEEGIRFVYIGNAADCPDGEDTFCPSCGHTLIRRDGYEIISNLVKPDASGGGKCPFCGEEIPGRFC
jgi:pyruvate formate lyase activating enzyme